MSEPYATITIICFCIIGFIGILISLLDFFYVNNKDIYTDGKNYYKWLKPYNKDGIQGNYWRPLKKHWVFYTTTSSDLWLSIDDCFIWTNVKTKDDYPLLDRKDYIEIVNRLNEYDKSNPKEDELEFIKELQFNYSLSRKQVFRIIKYIRTYGYVDDIYNRRKN